MDPRRRFRFLKELSEGAFGKVYMAEMITGDNFRSIVAIKLLHGKWLAHEEIVQRSRDEARVLGLLHHRNIIRVEDLTSINGQCAIVMEYLDGVDLKTLINYTREQGSRVPRKVAFEVIAAVASALEAAYNQAPLQGGEPLHLIHRDIKPSNVMITKAGDVKVLDFGTAQARFDEREAHTQALAFGSAAYMAPERLLGDPDAPSGDVFSLGVTLYELLASKSFGKVHIRPEKYEAAVTQRLDGLDLADLGPERSAQVRQVLRLMLSYEAEDRPTARQVVDLMEALADEVHDGSMRRFARTVVTPCREQLEPVANEDDPLTGSTLFEDRTGARGGTDTGGFPVASPDEPLSDGDGAASVVPGGGETWVEDPESPFQVPPELAAPPEELVDDGEEATAPPGVEASASGPRPAAPADSPWVGVDDPGPVPPPRTTGGPRLGDPRSDSTPSFSGGAGVGDHATTPPAATGSPAFGAAASTGSGASERPAGVGVAPATSGSTATPDGGSAPAYAANTRPASAPPPPAVRGAPVARASTPTQRPERTEASSGGGKGVIIGVAAVVVLGVLGVGGWFTVNAMGLLGDEQAPRTEAKATAGVSGGTVEVGEMNGSNGALSMALRPPGSATVSISSPVTGFKQEWDGSGRLVLKGLPAGTYRTKVAPKSGKAVRATLEVKAGQTCSYDLAVGKATEWNATGCE